ncbi:MAG: hypothetical protein EPO61_03070 [Nitrospirae bacterium]|nr:MAG: hypothetical protein EPO61_03070 [Nitrospirota bacterium]
MRWLRVGMIVAAPLILSGCHYYEEFRMMKGTADIRSETADLIRAYRECMERYEKEPAKAREYCSGYSQTLREIQPAAMGAAGRDSGKEKP